MSIAQNKEKTYSSFLHVIFISLIPIFILYTANIGKISLDELIISIIIITGFPLIIFWFFKKKIRVDKIALVISITMIVIFSYGHLYNFFSENTIFNFDLGRTRYVIPIITIPSAIMIFFIFKTNKNLHDLNKIIAITSIVFFLVIVSNTFIVTLNNFDCVDCLNTEFFYETRDFSKYFDSFNYSIQSNQSLPNVYYLILDEYARSDLLKEYHKFDNSDIINFLELKGFHIAEQSFSNYPMSIQSIPATMNMDYINFLQKEIGQDVRNYKPLNEKNYGLYANNQVIKNFKTLNYNIVTFNTFALHLYPNPLSDLILCERQVNLLDNKLIDSISRMSIFGYLVERWGEEQLRQVTKCALNEFPMISEKIDSPFFVWAHVMLPHPPWIFGPNGEEITPGKPLLITDNPEYRDSQWDVKRQYIQQLEFANKNIKNIVNKILEIDPYSIIVIQGDHGTAWDINWDEPSDEEIFQRLRNFDAIYFPDEIKRDRLEDDRTLVNTFRIIFNQYFDAEYKILEDKMYWGKNLLPYSFANVTDSINRMK